MKALSEIQCKIADTGSKCCKKGDWVEVHSTILQPNQRSKDVPLDTSLVPLESWVRGWAQNDAQYGQEITVETPSGRKVKGILVAENPGYGHTYGPTVPELSSIGKEVRKILKGGEGGNYGD